MVDKELKKRLVGILDYWSQSALKPYHVFLNKILKGIKEDCTFNQDTGFKSISIDGKSLISSFDIEGATDSIPAYLSKLIFERIFGEEKANAWYDLLVKCEYDLKGEKYFYGTGQPMGAYSSWPMMAITHHFILYYARIKHSVSNSGQYFLLGDDIVLKGKKIINAYHSVINEFGIPIQLTKSFMGKTMFEFAKRVKYKDSEITPFPLGSLLEANNSYQLITSSFEQARDRGWDAISLSQTLFRKIFKIFNKGDRLANNLAKMAWLFNNRFRPTEPSWVIDPGDSISNTLASITRNTWSFSCNFQKDTIMDIILESYSHSSLWNMNKSVIDSAKNFNILVANQKELLGTDFQYAQSYKIYHNSLRDYVYEYQVYSGVVNTGNWKAISEVEHRDFTPMTASTSSVFFEKSHSKRMRSQAILSHRINNNMVNHLELRYFLSHENVLDETLNHIVTLIPNFPKDRNILKEYLE